ncbi:MAG TPA: permease, partial [Smithellaceae bacterium]|nr:permease [Smithellaceae bacterium]HQH05533.1 permease [Smithellaceae bacterium]
FIFRRDDANRETGEMFLPEEEGKGRALWQDAVYMLVMVLILVFASFAGPTENDGGLWRMIFSVKWFLVMGLLVVLGIMLKKWFVKQELQGWVQATWDFAKQILPLLFGGVLVAGFLLGRPGYPALIPEQYIQALVGGNSLWANFFAAVVGAFMYFATLTEVPILQGLIGSGMGQGPALALLLAGPALSLPSMIAISSIMGIRKTVVYCSIVVLLSTVAGMAYGWLMV